MKAYSIQSNHVIINGIPVTGYAEGDDVITLKRRTPLATDKMGADGRMAVSISADRSGELKIKLMQTSPTNKYLAGLCALEQHGCQTFVPVLFGWLDEYRNDAGVGSVGYISEMPEIKRGAGVNEQEWTFIVERLDLLLGDPAFAGLPTAVAEMMGG